MSSILSYSQQVLGFQRSDSSLDYSTPVSHLVTKIQSVWRGYIAKTRVSKLRKNSLDYSLYLEGLKYLKAPEKLRLLPLANEGKTKVYLPREVSIVLKESGFPQNQRRLLQMQQARQICELHGYRGLSIPKARIHGHFILENKLPIQPEIITQMGLYLEYRELFTGAIREFVGFLCRCNLSDIVGKWPFPFFLFPYGPFGKDLEFGRYDNIPLYLEANEDLSNTEIEGASRQIFQGKIGLIDLERFSLLSKPLSSQDYFERCLNAVCLFPHHFEEILEVIKNFDPLIDKYLETLQAKRLQILESFDMISKHLSFLKNKNISPANPLHFEIDESKLLILQDSVWEKMVQIHLKNGEQGFNWLGSDLEKSQREFSVSFPLLTKALITEIRKNLALQAQASQIESKKISISSLLQIRILLFCQRGHCLKGWGILVLSYLTMLAPTSFFMENTCTRLPDMKMALVCRWLDLFFLSLAELEEISSYHRNIDRNGECIIFF